MTQTTDIIAGEQGHAGPLPGMLIGAIGAILLGVAVAGDWGWLAIVAGIMVAIGIVGAFLMHHLMVEYDIYARIENLEKK
jgi:membrane protein YdbS with pleckstrin-like domain